MESSFFWISFFKRKYWPNCYLWFEIYKSVRKVIFYPRKTWFNKLVCILLCNATDCEASKPKNIILIYLFLLGFK